jgi:hypothetical protein
VLDEPVQLPEGTIVTVNVEQSEEAPASEVGHLGAREIEDEIARIAASVPREAWASLPNDLSEQLDHYIYGTPKR